MTTPFHGQSQGQSHGGPETALAQVLLVEDEVALAENYTLALERAGYRVTSVTTPADALAQAAEQWPDVALIDVGLGRDADAGFELCRALRARSERLPILFLTARDDELDVISGLRLGADDYLTKDISLAQLVARVQTVLRRVRALAAAPEPGAERRVGPLRLQLSQLVALWRDAPVPLTVTEFHLVAALAERPGQVLSRAQLMDAAGVVLDDQTITAHVKRIRRKFEALDDDFAAIGTVYGLGYRWMPPTADPA